MGLYESGLLSSIFAEDSILPEGTTTLHFKENLLGGTSLVDGSGDTILRTMPSAAGGETVYFGNGDTGHLTETLTGGFKIDMPGLENDIIGRPSIFDEVNLYQGGEHIGTIEPDFMGNGIDITMNAGASQFTAFPGVTGGVQTDFTSPMLDQSSGWQDFNLQNNFSEIETISSHVSAADLGSASDAVDGVDFLDFL
ncbi:hypothetical protein FZC84_21530 [Rossellomorea vietnamensis]|uniref:Uncharacterized protein n=1 Tax=Rossellomorea vietnamensis TaxID=218284 RepID=A0A5D4M387_9BACI|nr:hypothetical protein [Rossellomorea vietnamensis]TYR95540.1 hypothetical protein FZC84_21530 [Rossellomorea vietnamensis]